MTDDGDLKMADETFTARRGIGGDKKQQQSPTDEAAEAHGPVLMEGPAKRQGEGWKGMKPWNDRCGAARAAAAAACCGLLRRPPLRTCTPLTRERPSRCGRFLVLRASALLCYTKGVQGPPENTWKLEQVVRARARSQPLGARQELTPCPRRCGSWSLRPRTRR